MEEIIFREAKESEYARLAAMAKELWHSAYDGLLGAAQTEYMTDEFQSEGALREQINKKGYRYYFIERGGAEIGYCGVQPQGDKFFLSKLYLSDDWRAKKGRGACISPSIRGTRGPCGRMRNSASAARRKPLPISAEAIAWTTIFTNLFCKGENAVQLRAFVVNSKTSESCDELRVLRREQGKAVRIRRNSHCRMP